MQRLLVPPTSDARSLCLLSATDDATTLIFCNAKLKHIDLRYHFTRTMIEANKIKLTYCPTYHQAADILTKPTDLLTFVRHRNTLMGLPSKP